MSVPALSCVLLCRLKSDLPQDSAAKPKTPASALLPLFAKTPTVVDLPALAQP